MVADLPFMTFTTDSHNLVENSNKEECLSGNRSEYNWIYKGGNCPIIVRELILPYGSKNNRDRTECSKTHWK